MIYVSGQTGDLKGLIARPAIYVVTVLALAGSIPAAAYAEEPAQVPAAAPVPAVTTVPAAAPATAAPTVAQPIQNALTIAVMLFEADGLDVAVVQSVATVFINEIRRIPGSKVFGPQELVAAVGEDRARKMAACGEISCMTGIAGVLGADVVIKATLLKATGSALFNVKLFDTTGRGGRPEIQFSMQLAQGTGPEFMAAIPQALSSIFPAHATIWVQSTPLAAPAPPAKAGPSITQWVLIGGGAALIVAGGVCNYLAQNDYNEWKNVPENDPRNISLKDSAQLKQTVGFSLMGVGAAALAGGLIWYFVTKPADKPPVEEKKVSSLRLVPVFIGGYGAALSGNW
jgi:hypothetical protein